MPLTFTGRTKGLKSMKIPKSPSSFRKKNETQIKSLKRRHDESSKTVNSAEVCNFPATSSYTSLPLCAVAFILVLALSMAAYQRNYLWRDQVTLWEDVVKKSPNKARSYANLAEVCRQKGLNDLAVRYYQAGLRLDPYYADIHSNLGNIYQEGGLLDKAIEHHQAALNLDPNNSRIHNNLANAYFSKGLLDSSVEHYQMALKLNPNFMHAHFNLGVAYERKGLTAKAIEQYRTVLRLSPENNMARQNLNVLLRWKN
jgi:tetratricopeptide (TPR) repeat protein